MTYVVAEPCIKCKYTDCVEICPVMCFHEGANMLVIDPDSCIDCHACVDQCPVQAIYPEEELPAKWAHYVELNRRYAAEWPVISMKKTPLPGADDASQETDKETDFDPAPGEGDPA